MLDGIDARRPAGPDDRADRPDRLGQDDAGLARAALLRRRPPAACSIDGVDVRDVDADLAAARDRRHLAGSVPVLGDACARTSPSARPDLDDAEVERIARLAQAHEFIERLPDGYDTVIGERGHHALGRPAPAARDRARARGRPAHPDPRRRDGLGRRDDRGADPARPARGDARPDDADHRAPPLDDRARGRDRRPRRGPHRGARHARRAARDEPGLPRHLRARPARAPVRRRGRGARRRRAWRLRREGLAAGEPPRCARSAAREVERLVVAAHAAAPRDARPAARAVPDADDPRRSVSLLLATAIALAPPLLAKYAVDDGIRRHDLTRALVDRRRVPARRPR